MSKEKQGAVASEACAGTDLTPDHCIPDTMPPHQHPSPTQELSVLQTPAHLFPGSRLFRVKNEPCYTCDLNLMADSSRPEIERKLQAETAQRMNENHLSPRHRQQVITMAPDK